MAVTMNIKKSTSLTATVAADERPVVYLSARVSVDDGSNNLTQTIHDRQLYHENRAAVREQITAFQEMVYSVQDSQNAGEA